MLDVEFSKEELTKDIAYEWAIREFEGRKDLIVHFFLGQNKPDPAFFNIIKEAIIQWVPNTYGVETSYTQELDGHDMVISDVVEWKIKPLMKFVINTIKEKLDG